MNQKQEPRRRQRREKIPQFRLADALPVVGEFRDCRQLSDDHWQGVDVDGAVIDVQGGAMPPYVIVDTRQWRPLLSEWGFSHYGIIRVSRAAPRP
jgi:hypothetical protein